MAVETRRAERTGLAIAAAAVQALLGCALVIGLAGDVPARIDSGLKLFGIASAPPRPPIVRVVPRRAAAKRREGAAAPPNLTAKPTEVAAPPPVIPVLVPPPIVAAPIPGPGSETRAGAAPVPGPGTGSGGEGAGMGSGRFGSGEGGGGVTPARWLRGRIKNSDYPPAASAIGAQGDLFIRYVVGTDGRVSDCTVLRSTGNALLDETTCRLVTQRFHYKPARDATGKRVSDVVTADHHWVLDEPEER